MANRLFPRRLQVLLTILILILPVFAGPAAAQVIKGLVTNAATVTPVAGVTVQVYNSVGNSVSSASTNAEGEYSVTGLTPGLSYFARTFNSAGLVDQLFADACFPYGNACPVTAGTPIAVPTGSATADFNLVPGGTITGTVT